MSVGTVDNNVHSEVFGTLPVDFDCVEFSKRLYEVLYTMIIFPDDCEVVYDEREAREIVLSGGIRGFLGAGTIVLGTARRPEVTHSGFLKPQITGFLS
jgi:hypothetical protein